jgi:hypothetical protein
MGMFVVAIPAAYTAARTYDKYKMDISHQLKLCCPKWMKYMVAFLFAYCGINFIFGIIARYDGITRDARTGLSLGIRLFSGFWMFFYFALMGALAEILRLQKTFRGFCPCGHGVFGKSNRCSKCGGTAIPPG